MNKGKYTKIMPKYATICTTNFYILLEKNENILKNTVTYVNIYLTQSDEFCATDTFAVVLKELPLIKF